MLMRALVVADVAYLAVPDVASALSEMADRLDEETGAAEAEVVRGLIGSLLLCALRAQEAAET